VSLHISAHEDDKILECIDNGLDVFGSSVKDVIYWRFQKIYNHSRQDIVRKPELFSESLVAFFGERAFHVEQMVVGSLVNSFHLSNVQYSDSLTRAIHEAHKMLRESSQ
jgi:hypothetical protein